MLNRDKTPVPKGFRGWDYARFVHQKKEDANWTCSICGWQPKEKAEHVNIVAHHPHTRDLYDVIIICEACHYNIHWGEL
jgi:C4-type Zn-finger protein